jgi:enoyl-CoA hydratase/carnithine racemase
LTDLLYQVHDRVATITLNRPAQRNAFTIEMVDAWADRLGDAQADPGVHVIVVTGASGAFCSGIDLSWLEDDLTPLERKRTLAEHVHRVPLELETVDKPVIAAINGVAVGAGLDMALMCDLRLAARSARMAESYVKVGLVPGDGGCYLLPRLLGLPRALELLLTGDMIAAERAAEIGMINSVHDDDKLDDAVADLAGRLAAGPPIALRMIKRATYQSQRMDLRTSLDLISSHLALNRTTHDSLEAFRAFRDHREPIFEGR